MHLHDTHGASDDWEGGLSEVEINRIFILEDDVEARKSLVALTRMCFPDAAVVEVGSIRDANDTLMQQRFDLALIDLNLPDGEGQTILQFLEAQHPATIRVVTTSMATDAAIVSALAAGASGYLLKTDPPALWNLHLRQLVNQVPVLSPAIARRIMAHFRQTGPVEDVNGRLTGRETEVLTFIAKGLRIPEVAQALGLADSTIATHIKNIYRKLGISNRAEAATHAARMGLL